MQCCPACLLQQVPFATLDGSHQEIIDVNGGELVLGAWAGLTPWVGSGLDEALEAMDGQAFAGVNPMLGHVASGFGRRTKIPRTLAPPHLQCTGDDNLDRFPGQSW